MTLRFKVRRLPTFHELCINVHIQRKQVRNRPGLGITEIVVFEIETGRGIKNDRFQSVIGHFVGRINGCMRRFLLFFNSPCGGTAVIVVFKSV